MAVRHWLDSNGNWTTAADWTGGVVPGSTDEAVIDAPGSYAVSENASSTAPIDVDLIEIGAGAVLAITDVTGNEVGSGEITSKGTLALDGTAVLSVTGGVTNSGTLDVDVFGGDGGASLTIAGTLANTGTGTAQSPTTHPAGDTLTLAARQPHRRELRGVRSASHLATLSFSKGGAGFTRNDGSFGCSTARR